MWWILWNLQPQSNYWTKVGRRAVTLIISENKEDDEI